MLIGGGAVVENPLGFTVTGWLVGVRDQGDALRDAGVAGSGQQQLQIGGEADTVHQEHRGSVKAFQCVTRRSGQFGCRVVRRGENPCGERRQQQRLGQSFDKDRPWCVEQRIAGHVEKSIDLSNFLGLQP